MNKQHTQLIDRLEESAAELANAVAQVPPQELLRVKREGEWSLHQALSHLRDTERSVFVYRAGRILGEDAPPAVAAFDQETWMREHYSPREPVKDILGEFRAARRKLVNLLRATRERDWTRYALHPDYGKVPLEYIAQHAYSHTLEHLQQFLEAREAALLKAANTN